MGTKANIITPSEFGVGLGENAILAQRPYFNDKGVPVISVNTGQLDKDGMPVYAEKRIHTNATLRKDEWEDLEDAILESARERLVIVADLRDANMVYDVGGLGTIISEWETASEITDAEITMDGESVADKDRQEFGLDGVPIPIIQKPFSIPERQLLASRQRGAALDVTTGTEAARAVARVMESLVFNGSNVGAVNSAGSRYTIPGLLTTPSRNTATISDWSLPATTPQTIFQEIMAMVTVAETQGRHYGPFNLYIPGQYAHRFREDFKEFGDKTLMQRTVDEDVINAVRVSDVLPVGNVVLIQMDRSVMDLGMASDVTTIQWASGSGWTNHFQVFSAMAPRIKASFDGYSGIVHGSV